MIFDIWLRSLLVNIKLYDCMSIWQIFCCVQSLSFQIRELIQVVLDNCRCMLSTSSATRSYYVNFHICSITPKTFSKYQAWAVPSTWNTSKSITMGAIRPAILMESFPRVQISTILLHMIERSSLSRKGTQSWHAFSKFAHLVHLLRSIPAESTTDGAS